jgi:tRNA pseudouridine55 synthase
MSGFLNLNKPLGITAHDCVSRVRKLLGQKQVGHSGTLDPSASGVLPIAVGNATRLLRFLPEGKAYLAKVRFGVITDSDDLEGKVLKQQSCPQISLSEIEALLPTFIGSIIQRPPSFSAIQVGGKRLYDLARAGEKVEAPLRTVEIHRIEIVNWEPGDFPEIDLQIDCGSGTYIRAIARDLGEKLDCGGVLAGLERNFSNGFHLAESLRFEQVHSEILIPSDRPIAHLLAKHLNMEQSRRWLHGQPILIDAQTDFQANSAINMAVNDRAIKLNRYIRVYNEGGKFLGIGEQRPDNFSEMPSQITNQALDGLSSDLPSDLPSYLPTELPNELPNELPSYLSSELPSHLPNQSFSLFPVVVFSN